MGNYCHVEDGVVTYAGHLPQSDRTTSGLRMLNDAELIKRSWLPMVEVKISYNRITHYLGLVNVDIQADKVVYTDNIQAFTADQLKQNAWNDWMSAMSTNDGYDNPTVTSLTRVDEDLMDLMDEIDSTLLDKPKYVILKARRADKRTLRAKMPPKP